MSLCISEMCFVDFQLQTDMPLGDSTTDVMSLLAPDLMPKLTTRPPPEMAACQTLVLAFVDALKKQELQVEWIVICLNYIGASLSKRMSDVSICFYRS